MGAIAAGKDLSGRNRASVSFASKHIYWYTSAPAEYRGVDSSYRASPTVEDEEEEVEEEEVEEEEVEEEEPGRGSSGG